MRIVPTKELVRCHACKQLIPIGTRMVYFKTRNPRNGRRVDIYYCPVIGDHPPIPVPAVQLGLALPRR